MVKISQYKNDTFDDDKKSKYIIFNDLREHIEFYKEVRNSIERDTTLSKLDSNPSCFRVRVTPFRPKRAKKI